MNGANFKDDLAFSLACSRAPWWETLYRTVFPDYVSNLLISRDGYAQRGGVDRHVHLASGKTVKIQEKARRRVYPDVALEYRHDFPHGKSRPGWATEDAEADFLAYAWVPSQRAILIPSLTLRLVWERFGQQWLLQAADRKSPFRLTETWNAAGYTSRCVAVPISTLLGAVRQAQCLAWDDQHGYLIAGQQLALDLGAVLVGP